MTISRPTTAVAFCILGGTLLLNVQHVAEARQTPMPLRMASSTGLEGLLVSVLLFTAADTNQDHVVTPDELTATLERWLSRADASKSGAATLDQLVPVMNDAMPAQALAAMLAPGRAQPQTPDPLTVQAMMAALPVSAPAKPVRPRKVLVLAHAAGFVHSSIPLAAKTIEALGTKTGAWAATITYDAADVNAENLKQYDAVFLASTTGPFLDDPADAAATTARRQALLHFVRGGKGLAGIHAASDSYHRTTAPAAENPFGAFSAGATLAPAMIGQGDRNKDGSVDKAEIDALADAWFHAIDVKNSGRLGQSDFAFFALLIPKASSAAPAAQGPDNEIGTWPEFNKMLGGFFKYHWLDPQLITVRIDDPKSPLTAMFHGKPFEIHDETYTMGIKSWSRENVHVLTSIDYDKMSAEDKALETNPRADHDYGLSWIRREGQGRVFYEAHGHSERVYAMRPMLEHLLAGIQYAIGDLKADDAPSSTPANRPH
jgi:type 1 glutamine amidotransferase